MPMIIDNWPYSNLHNINLDWILEQIKAMSDKVDNFELFFPHVSTWNYGEWDIDHAYQMNEIVTNGNDIYVAKKNVPPDENINNTEYWMLIGTVDDMSNKVDKSGDTMTGDLIFLDCNPKARMTGIDINSTPAVLVSHDIISTYDVNNTEVSMMRARQNTSGDVGVEFDARRQVGGSTIFNGVTFMIKDDGTRTMSVSETGQWKEGLGLVWTSTGNDWLTAVANAKMDLLITFSFAIGTSNIVLDIHVPVCELDANNRFHFSQTAYASGDSYHAQARCWTSGLDFTVVFDSSGVAVADVTTNIYYR